MKSTNMRYLIVAACVLLIAGTAATALAGQGYGRSQQGSGGPGNCPGWGGGQGYGQGSGYGPNMSQEDFQKMQDSRQAFFAETEDLRRSLYQKRLEMKSEFAKKEPDVGKLKSMQKEISGLRSEMDQKRLSHKMEMRKAFPDAGGWSGRGMMGGRGMGYGHGKGYGHGMGGYGRGMMGGGTDN